MAISVTVSPAGAGTVSQTVLFSWSGPGDDATHTVNFGNLSRDYFLYSDTEYEIELIGITATPSSFEYKFARYEVEYTYRQGSSETYTDNDHTIYNPTLEFASAWYGGIGHYSEKYQNGEIWSSDTNSITAIFTRRTPTDLLVNSSTAISPVTLVYDPTTNLLVADY